MKLFNAGEQFVIEYDGKEYTIPEGELEINNDDLGNFIIASNDQLETDVKKLEESKIVVKATISKTKKEDPVVSKENENSDSLAKASGEKASTGEKTKRGRKKASKELEESL